MLAACRIDLCRARFDDLGAGRGAAEAHKIHASANGWLALLTGAFDSTMWWIIASGAFHNFNMYAIGAFLSPFLQRFHP